MKTELEKKLNKLPAFIKVDDIEYHLKMLKDNEVWYIEYCDFSLNTILSVEHQSLQAAVDTTLKEIKSL